MYKDRYKILDWCMDAPEDYKGAMFEAYDTLKKEYCFAIIQAGEIIEIW